MPHRISMGRVRASSMAALSLAFLHIVKAKNGAKTSPAPQLRSIDRLGEGTHNRAGSSQGEVRLARTPGTWIAVNEPQPAEPAIRTSRPARGVRWGCPRPLDGQCLGP